MTVESRSFDPIWEDEIYGQGRQLNRYPFDAVVSFVFRNTPRDRPRHDVRILEIGCGAGNNLWFAAREGFSVTGIDASASAIAVAQRRLADEGFEADLQVGDFAVLPFEDDRFDLAIDRCALTCSGRSVTHRAVGEIHRVLKAGGFFFCNPYSDVHSSCASGEHGSDGLVLNIHSGTLVGVGQICFYNLAQVKALFAEGWIMRSVQHSVITEELDDPPTFHAEWRVIAQKSLR